MALLLFFFTARVYVLDILSLASIPSLLLSPFYSKYSEAQRLRAFSEAATLSCLFPGSFSLELTACTPRGSRAVCFAQFRWLVWR